MTTKRLTAEQMEILLQSLGYQLYPSEGPQRVFENRNYGAIQLLPQAGKEAFARLEHLMTLRKVSIEKGIVDEQTFDELLEKAYQQHAEPTATTAVA